NSSQSNNEQRLSLCQGVLRRSTPDSTLLLAPMLRKVPVEGEDARNCMLRHSASHNASSIRELKEIFDQQRRRAVLVVTGTGQLMEADMTLCECPWIGPSEDNFCVIE